MKFNIKLAAALAALSCSASVATNSGAPSLWKNHLKTGGPSPYPPKERGKAQWKIERNGRK